MRVLALLLAAAGALAGCQDAAQPTRVVPSPLADSADQVMFGARALLVQMGIQQAELFADTAFWFDENTRAELRGVRLIFFNEIGARSGTLTSREGTYNTRTGQMEARGNVVVIGEDGRRLVTEQLRYNQARDEISSDSAFVLTQPGGRRVAGVGFVSDPDMDRVRCLAACSGVGGTVELNQ